MKQPIRLTNKTAIALRKNAQTMRTAHYVSASVLSIGMAVAAVYFGVKWLPTVPLMVVACVLIDCAIVMHARNQYLMTIGQAICTEAAARDIRMGGREQKRKERAINDLLEAKADIRKAAPGKTMHQPMQKGQAAPSSAMYEDEDAEDEESDAPRRRRQQKSLQLIKNNRAK